MILSTPPMMSGHPKLVRSSRRPASAGVDALARLRGTFVTLAAAARSSGSTTRMTSACRAGTSSCDSVARKSRNVMASGALGHDAREDQENVGGQMSEDHRAHETEPAGEPRREQLRERSQYARCGQRRTGCCGREAEPEIEVEDEQRLHRKAAAGGIDREQHRQPNHDRARTMQARAAATRSPRDCADRGTRAPHRSRSRHR